MAHDVATALVKVERLLVDDEYYDWTRDDARHWAHDCELGRIVDTRDGSTVVYLSKVLLSMQREAFLAWQPWPVKLAWRRENA